MRRIFCISMIISFLLLNSNAWPQQESEPITQGDLARLFGERLGYKEEPITKLKQVGVTPLGEWASEKPMTVADLDAILIRITRRDPVVENMEPAKLLDSIGFSPRDVSRRGIDILLKSDIFKRVIINLRLLLSPPIIPLPLKFLTLMEAIAAGPLEATATPLAAAPIVAIPGTAPVEEEPPPPPPDEPPPPPPDDPPKPSW